MSSLDFFLTASIFACLGYGLCYLTLAKSNEERKGEKPSHGENKLVSLDGNNF